MAFGDDTLDPSNKPEPAVKKKHQFRRQLALLAEDIERQEKCPHTLKPLTDGAIICTECFAIWVK